MAGKAKDTFTAGNCCLDCGKRIEDLDLVSRRGPGQSAYLLCDACVDKLRVSNGMKPQGPRDYSGFYEQEQLDLDEIERRIRGYQTSIAGYLRMLKEQNNRCAICSHHPKRAADLVIDHNHKTGEVRGLLCSKCNTALGMFRDSPLVLEAALDYLEVRGFYGLDAQEHA